MKVDIYFLFVCSLKTKLTASSMPLTVGGFPPKSGRLISGSRVFVGSKLSVLAVELVADGSTLVSVGKFPIVFVFPSKGVVDTSLSLGTVVIGPIFPGLASETV